jgi:hypothetical protein
MGDEPNISKISFEEIQEFQWLNLFDIPSSEDGTVIILTYDPATRVFSVAEVNLGTSVINLTQESTLLYNITTATDDLPVERGYVFKKGETVTEVLQRLASPIFNAKVTLSSTNNVSGITSDNTLLVEIATPSQITFSHVYEKRQAGNEAAGTDLYYLDNVAATNPKTLTYNTITSGEFKIKVTSESNTSFDASDVFDTMDVKSVYPIFHGVSAVDSKPNDFTAGSLVLADIVEDGEVELPISGETDAAYYWFGIHTSITPINWIGVYSNGTLQYSNEGLMLSNFNNKGTVIYKGFIYNVYMTKSKTLFEQNIKLNF